MAKMKVAERRKSPRVQGDFNVEIADHKSKIIARTINVSGSGIYCQCDHAIPLFREIRILMRLPDNEKQLEFTGVIVRCEKISGKHRYNLAIFFSDISPQDKKLLSKYIEDRLVTIT